MRVNGVFVIQRLRIKYFSNECDFLDWEEENSFLKISFLEK